MGNVDERCLRTISRCVKTFLLKIGISDSQHLVHQKQSGSKKAATEKPRRICIPTEKNFTWRFMAFSRSANSTMSSNFFRMAAAHPRTVPYK